MNIGSDEGLAIRTGTPQKETLVIDHNQAAREAFEAWFKANWNSRAFKRFGCVDQDFARCVWFAASRSIPAAAALLRAAGWRVEEPPCGNCKGAKRISFGLFKSTTIDCPTCNGTGAAKGDGR